MLPHEAQIEDVTSDDVLFRDGAGHLAPVDDFSDGYRSILSLAFELLRNLVAEFGDDGVFDATGALVKVSGG